MRSRFATLKALFSAGLIAAFCLRAAAQSAQSGQPIVFTSPDGQTVSNALLPVVQAPGTQELPDMPGAQADRIVTPAMPGEWLPQPGAMPVTSQNLQDRDMREDRDIRDLRESLGIKTPAEMMGVQALREMFGLPKSDTTNSLSRNNSTNILSSDEESQQPNESSWARILSTDSEAFNSTKAENSNSMDKGFFDSVSGDSLFQGKKSDDKLDDKSDDNNMFGVAQPAQTTGEQTAWDTAVQIATPETAPATTMAPAASPAASAFDAPLSPPSPFTLPNDNVATMPQLPSLPDAPGQNNLQPPATTPSWAPKPPPWASPTPAVGTMAQRKF